MSVAGVLACNFTVNQSSSQDQNIYMNKNCPSHHVFLTPLISMGPSCFYNCLGSHLNQAEEELLLFSETKQAQFIQIETKWNRNEMK